MHGNCLLLEPGASPLSENGAGFLVSSASFWLREALAVSRQTVGDCHPYTLVSINNLADLLKGRGHLADA